MQRRIQQGFTLIELAVVLAVLALGSGFLLLAQTSRGQALEAIPEVLEFYGATEGNVSMFNFGGPVGGALADRFGGIRTLTLVYALAALLLTAIAMVATSGLATAVALFVAVVGTLGVGNGAVFQLVPQRFRKEIGVMTGLVGFGGGIGGFYLAASLGAIKKATGSASIGFLIFAALAVVALIGLTAVKRRWRTTWGAALQGARI